MDHPVPVTSLPPAAARFADPGAPSPVKMMAASGLAPLGPTDLLKVLYALAYDPDPAVSGKARETASKLPDNICQTIAQIEDAPVIDGLARILLKREAAIARVILNRSTADETVVFLASRIESERVLEIMFANEVRLLRCPQIIEALYLNPAARMSSVDRAVELAVRNGVELKGIPTFAEIRAAVLGEAEKKAAAYAQPPQPAQPATLPAAPAEDDLLFVEDEAAGEDAGAFDGAKLEDFLAALERGEKVTPDFFRAGKAEDDLEFLSVLGDETARSFDGAKLDEILDALEQETGSSGEPRTAEEEERAKRMEASLSRLTVSQKIRVATLGNANQRAVLVRDANKLVVMAVLKSPGVGDSEVIRFSQARSLPDDAVRLICNTREWTKSYQVKLNLVNNPKTPIQDALRFMTHLRPNDLRLLENSRDVPRAVVSAAKQLRTKRGG